MFNINNEQWYLSFISDDHDVLLQPNGHYTLGACDINTHHIYINNTLPLMKYKRVLIHELTHAYIASYHLILTQFSEEIIADFLASYGEEIILLADTLFQKTLKGNLFL